MLVWPFRGIEGAQTTRIDVDGIGPLTITGQPARDPHIFGRLARGEMFEPHILAAMRAITPQGACFVDIGANIGVFTLCAARLVGPSGHVVAIEPEPRNVRLLRRNLRQNAVSAVRVLPVALSDGAGRARLGLSPSNAGDNRLGGWEQRDGVQVHTRRLDAVRLPAQGELVLKLDIQGGEVAALRGAGTLLNADRPVRVLVEFWPYGLDDCGSSAEALIALLERHFQRFWIIWSHCGPLPVRPEELRQMAATNLAPAGQMFADIVALRDGDEAGIAGLPGK